MQDRQPLRVAQVAQAMGPGAGGAALQASSCCPPSVQVVGRRPDQENADICGRYVYRGKHQGRALYQKPGSAAAIRYWAPTRRWVLDRQGVRESDVVVAYADDTEGFEHPAHVQLLWQVYETSAKAHVQDADLAVLDAPETVTLVGRGTNRENCGVNGEYVLTGICNGRPRYLHKGGETVLRYYAPEDRWLVAAARMSQNICSAFADAAGSAPHPGFAELEWHFWEAQRESFMRDPSTRTLAAPGHLHVIGRSPQAENGQICGTYRLAGVHNGRPAYVQPGTQAIIRYSAKHDWWLIDSEGLAEPSMLGKLYQWMLSGDGSATSERCSAYAEAHGSAAHPGLCALEWRVWSSRSGQHIFDPMVRATTAALAVRVSGRGASRENDDINGDYVIAGTHNGYPAYQHRSRAQMAIRFWPPTRRWVIDRSGLRNSDACVAYADSPDSAEQPAATDCSWHVYETSRGCHIADPALSVSVPSDVPEALPEVAAEILGPSSKRRRLDMPNYAAGAQDAGCYQHPQHVHTASGGGSTWLGLFGGA